MTTFNGFEPANTTPVPDTLFDVLLSKLSGAELKVMLYIIRRTLGFKKTDDTISFTQFEKGIITSEGKVLDEGTGLSRETINKALQSLEDRGCIKSDKRYTALKDKDVTLYSIHFSGDDGVVGKSDYQGSQIIEPPVVGNSDHGSQKNRVGVVRKSDLQETVLQDTDKQETVLQEREVADATARSQSSSQDNLSEDETVKREAVKPSQKEVVHVQNQSHSGNPGNSSQPHLDTGRNSIPLDASLTSQKDVAQNGHHQRPIVDHHSPADSHQPEPSQPEHRKDTNRNTEPPHPRKPPTNPVPRRPKQQGLMDEIPKPVPPEAIAIMDRWDSNHTKPSPRGEKTIKAAILLIPFNPTKEELKACEEWLFTTDRPGKPWYRSHGVHLPDIAEKIGSWQSLQNAPPAKPEKEPSNEHKAVQHANAFIARGYDKEYNKRKLEEMRAENERRRQAQAGGVQL